MNELGSPEGVAQQPALATRPDGNVQVSFETAGPPGAEPGLAKRLREGYLRRMGH